MTDIPDFIQKTIDDIKTFKIRSATTIAKAIFDVLDDYALTYDLNGKTPADLYTDYEFVANSLATARDTEPMARNGVKYVMTSTRLKCNGSNDLELIRTTLAEKSKEYFELINHTKDRVTWYGAELLKDGDLIYTHCNSTTAENILKAVDSKNTNLRVIADETRPRMQGRITATNLHNAGLNVIFIPDTAASSVLTNSKSYPVDAVIIGADEITFDGDAINQIGSLNIALAAYTMSIPIYVVTPSLKLGVETLYSEAKIEERADAEVWQNAPGGIEILNPVFEKVPKEYITGYITEFGLIKPDEFADRILKEYEWLV